MPYETWLASTVPAATIVVFRRDPAGGAAQLLLVERNATLQFAGGATVFPGGKIDESDRALAARLLDADNHGAGPAIKADRESAAADMAARVTAIRETLEETGLVVGIAGAVDGQIAAEARRMLLQTGDLSPVLDAFGWQLAPEQLVPFARWWPRSNLERVFDTRFYLADLGTGAVDIAVDATENHHMFWASAEQALNFAANGQIRLIFPTRRNLERLAQFDSFAAARAHALETPMGTVTPYVEQHDGELWLMIPDNLGYPVRGEPLAGVQRT